MPNLGASVDTAANWKSTNPTPNLDELCIERDTGVMKLGDGSTPYNSLSTLGGGGSVLIAKKEFETYGTPIANSSNTGYFNVGSLAFTVPSSGKVQALVRASLNSTSYPWTFAFGSSSAGSDLGIAFNALTQGQAEGSVLVTGLTPGSTYTVYLSAWGGNNGSAPSLYGCEVEVYSA